MNPLRLVSCRLLPIVAGLCLVASAVESAAAPGSGRGLHRHRRGEETLDEILRDVERAPSRAPETVPSPKGRRLRSARGAGDSAVPHVFRLLGQFRWAVLGSVAAGFLCSFMGTIVLARRMMLLGIALPQAASAGIALVLLLAQWAKHWSLKPGESPFLEETTAVMLAPFGSLGTVLVVLTLLAWAERRTLFHEAQWATVYITGLALVVILLVLNPYGEAHMATMLEGNIITVSRVQFVILAAVAVAVGAFMVLLRKEFLLVSFDPEMAWSLRFNLPAWNAFLYVLLGVTVSTTVMITGPMFAFGYLLLPPFAARPWAKGMRAFYILATVLGVVSSLVGCLVSFELNWPLGPSQVLTAAAVLLLSRLLLLCRHRAAHTQALQEQAPAEAA
ncbi:MAG: metal ABC transporter permease [Verrucomicrobia bacterium]|nr:metal ABC transporter permease [Verrucomicrobiota bacterium]